MGRALLAAVLASVLWAGTALASDFEHPASSDPYQQYGYGSVQRQDTPNDPNYDQAEPDTTHRTSTNLYDERFDLFGFPSMLTPSARYVEGTGDQGQTLAGLPQVAGFNAAGAWKVTRGRPDVVIAILDTGIRWENPSLRDQIHLNTGELPLPERADGTTDPSAPLGGYDLNRNGAVDVDDYANDPRVLAVKPAGEKLITAEDLIHAFSNGRDDDHNGYVDDIAGWDFFDNDNDPFDQASYFAATDHGTGRAQDAAETGNDGQGSIGVCPHCQIMPVRIWDTFVSDADTFGLGITYATDNGAAVIEGANGSVYHSRFAEAASDYAYQHGVVQTYSGDDLNTGNHNFPASYSHTMEIQGTVPDTDGLGQNIPGLSSVLGPVPLGTELPPATFFRGANLTQYGGHSSISMEGDTGSVNTGKAAGAAGLVISAARDRGVTLTPDETREILEQTAEDVLPGNTAGTGAPDASQAGWDPHFGWGRADVGAAVAVAAHGQLPPQAAIDSPDWYAPLAGATAHLTGRLSARSGSFHYKVEWGPGMAPTSWTTLKEGDSSSPVTDLGTLDMNAVRSALASYTQPADAGMPTFAPGEPNPYSSQFAVRVTVTQAGEAVPGVDRRVFTAVSDPTLRHGFPRRMGTGGESPIRYADLNGDGVQELVVPLEDGTVHAFEPNGRELRGWPVRTRVFQQASDHLSSPALRALGPPLEPLRGPTIADLDGNGTQEVVAAAGRHVYVWEPNGKLRRGFPVSIDPALCRGADQSQPLHHRKCGILAVPALGHLQGRNKPLDIVVPALDGHLYAWDDHGHLLPHFPVDLVDPSVPANQRMYAEATTNPAIGDLNGDGRDDVVVASDEYYGATQPNPSDLAGGFAQGLADILAHAAGGSSRLYAVNGATGGFLPGWPVALNGALQNEFPMIGPGQDPSLVRLGGRQVVVASTTGGALAEYGTDGTLIRAAQQGVNGPASDVTDRTGPQLNLFENASIGNLLGTGPDLLKYAVTLGQVANLALPGQNFPYNHTIGAFDAQTGLPLPAWPVVTDDYQFLSASDVAKVDPTSPAQQVLAGTGLGLLHAYDGATGRDAPGFPKVTGGWLFAPAAVSSDGRIADITREGYLFEWSTKAPACQTEWPSFRHDPHGTGNYDADGTPPAAPGRLRLRGSRLSFIAPGDDGRCGTASAYLVWVNGRRLRGRLARPVAGGRATGLTIRLPRGTRTVALAARDDAGNVGPAATVRLARRHAAAERRARRRHAARGRAGFAG